MLPRLAQACGQSVSIPVTRRAGSTTRMGRPILAGEREVALVVRRHGHDRAGAIGHQHVVGDPDGDRAPVDRVDGIGAGEDAGLFLVGRLRGRSVRSGGLRPRCSHRRLRACGGRGQLRDQRMLGRQDHEGHAPERVGPGREDVDLIARSPCRSRRTRLRCDRSSWSAVADPSPANRAGRSPAARRHSWSCVKNHWSRSFLITGVSQRSQWRSSPSTCSRARVVLQLGQKSTGAYFR